jgi:hypothetical protein
MHPHGSPKQSQPHGGGDRAFVATATGAFTQSGVPGAATTIAAMRTASASPFASKASPRRWRSLSMTARHHLPGRQRRHFAELQQVTTSATVTATSMPEIVKSSNANIVKLLGMARSEDNARPPAGLPGTKLCLQA